MLPIITILSVAVSSQKPFSGKKKERTQQNVQIFVLSFQIWLPILQKTYSSNKHVKESTVKLLHPQL